ncbi:MAG: FHA domain-containing protein, partial [Planctomycetota bacterium]
MPRLIVTGSDGQDRVFEFEGGVVRIGRADGNSIVVDDPAAEPEHCVIEPQPDGRYKL